MESNLIDRYCASPHAAPITAAAYDPRSGAAITADGSGTVAITKPGEEHPSILFDMGAPVRGAVAVCTGGTLVAVGDDAGTVAVYKTWDGSCAFEDVKEGAAGAARAVRSVAFHPDGTILASVSVDGIIRVFGIQRWERLANYQGFAPRAIEFDPVGERLLVIDDAGQPKLLDLVTQAQASFDTIAGGVKVARFTPDGTHVVAMGESGLTLLEVASGELRTSFAARGSSGMLTVVMAPDGSAVAAVTGRSVHRFDLPDLTPATSAKHGASDPTGTAVWDPRGVAVGGGDGRMHRPGTVPSLQSVTCCTRFGPYRVGAHGKRLALWTDTKMREPLDVDFRFVEVKIDREGQLLAGLPDDGSGAQVYHAGTGEHLFDAGPATADTRRMEVAGTVFASMTGPVGLKWIDLSDNQVFELPWVAGYALSGSGSWLAVITPRGHLRVLDPSDGEEVMIKPVPPADDAPARMLAFMNRMPELLVLDGQGVLGMYDLAPSVKEGTPARVRDILNLNVEVDRMWGITGGRLAAVRYQVPGQGGAPDTSTVIYVDVRTCEVVSEVPNLLPYAWVDPESGDIVQPARGAAILELDMHGHDKRVLRALPEGEWVAFSPEGVLARSDGARL